MQLIHCVWYHPADAAKSPNNPLDSHNTASYWIWPIVFYDELDFGSILIKLSMRINPSVYGFMCFICLRDSWKSIICLRRFSWSFWKHFAITYVCVYMWCGAVRVFENSPISYNIIKPNEMKHRLGVLSTSWFNTTNTHTNTYTHTSIYSVIMDLVLCVCMCVGDNDLGQHQNRCCNFQENFINFVHPI